MSGAVGRYQIINKTLKELQKKLGLPDDQLFNAEVQDRLATVLLERRGLNKFLNGQLSLKDFMKNLSKEWASLPNPDTGKSYYGQRTHFSVSEFEQVLTSLKYTEEQKCL
jgi:muramidase (phage lysozyme)